MSKLTCHRRVNIKERDMEGKVKERAKERVRLKNMIQKITHKNM